MAWRNDKTHVVSTVQVDYMVVVSDKIVSAIVDDVRGSNDCGLETVYEIWIFFSVRLKDFWIKIGWINQIL